MGRAKCSICGSRIEIEPKADLFVRFVSMVPAIWYLTQNREKGILLAAMASLAIWHFVFAPLGVLAARTFGWSRLSDPKTIDIRRRVSIVFLAVAGAALVFFLLKLRQ